MRLHRFLGLILVLCIGFYLPVRGAVKAEPSAIDLGRRLQEQRIDVEVKLSNDGKEAVEILNVSADCSCTAAVPDKRTLAPGEATTLAISVETRGYYGKIRRNIHVQTSAGDLTIPIDLTIAMFKSWMLEPATIVFPPSSKGREAEMQVSLSYTGEGKVEIRKISCDPGFLQVHPASEDGRNYVLKLMKPADSPAGNYSIKVVIETSDAEEPQISFNVFASIASALRITPNPIVLPTVKVGQTSSREFFIQNWIGNEYPRVEVQDGLVKSFGLEGERLKFEISFTPSTPGPMTRLLRIYDGKTLESEIPVILRAEGPDKVQ
ncbi:MAG: DUF1573 domain-containing protein [Nibricoccus sp.]